MDTLQTAEEYADIFQDIKFESLSDYDLSENDTTADISFVQIDDLQISNFIAVDPLGDLTDEEMDQPVGLAYWTESRIVQFADAMLKCHLKRLFDPHSGTKLIKEMMDWVFDKPIFTNPERISLFSYQHLCIVTGACPHDLRSKLNGKLIEFNVYDKLDEKVQIQRFARAVGLNYTPDEKTKAKITQKLTKRFNNGDQQGFKTLDKLLKNIDKQFNLRETELHTQDDLFCKRNVRQIQRLNGDVR
jgi:hypothetical protein